MSDTPTTAPTTPTWSEIAVWRALDRTPPPGAESRTFSEISTDTRAIKPGALFVALSGERFDGHAYLDAARASGARAAIVRAGTPPVDGLELIEVEDPLRAYGLLARARRRALTGPVVAVTGTNGKTSTKEMLAAALRTRYRTHATRANLNNLVGVPLTILEASPDTDALVVEAGANLPGEIARYREMIEPDVVVVTNTVAGHLEGFGSLAGVLAEKLALVDGVRNVVVGTEPAELVLGARRRAGHVVTAALRDAEIVPTHVAIDGDARPVITIDGHTFTLPLRGLHQADNAIRVWAVAKMLGLDLAAVAQALGEVRLPGGRGEVMEQGGVRIVHDAYNANPQSFRSAIATAAALRQGRRLVFIAGTMRELGADAERLHAEVARELVALAPDVLGAVGDFVPALAPYAKELGDRLVVAPDPLALGPLVHSRLAAGDVIVLKASRGVALERILPWLTTATTP